VKIVKIPLHILPILFILVDNFSFFLFNLLFSIFNLLVFSSLTNKSFRFNMKLDETIPEDDNEDHENRGFGGPASFLAGVGSKPAGY